MYNIELRKMLLEKFGTETANQIAEFFTSEAVLQQMHMAIEDQLIELRDSHIGVVGPRNGWVVNEKDGTPSPILRFGTRDGLRFIMRYLTDNEPENQHRTAKQGSTCKDSSVAYQENYSNTHVDIFVIDVSPSGAKWRAGRTAPEGP